MQLEGFVGIVFPDDALGVVLLDPGLPGLSQINFHHTVGVLTRAIYLVFKPRTGFVIFLNLGSVKPLSELGVRAQVDKIYP